MDLTNVTVTGNLTGDGGTAVAEAVEQRAHSAAVWVVSQQMDGRFKKVLTKSITFKAKKKKSR